MGELQSYIVDHNKDLCTKMEVVRRLQKLLKDKKGESLFFDKSVIFKTELAHMFIDYMHLDVDRDLVLTACLLCNCKKVDNPQKKGKLFTYAEEGADYLEGLGFEKRFCKICKGVNRYSESQERNKGKIPEIREPESDILELVDNFGGMMLDRPERKGFTPEEALIQMERDNLKGVNNRYLKKFHDFVSKMQEVEIKDSKSGLVNNKILPKTKKVIDENDIDKLTLGNVMIEFNEIADKRIKQKFNYQEANQQEALFGGISNNTYQNDVTPTRTLFTKEAIQAARSARGFNNNIEDDYER